MPPSPASAVMRAAPVALALAALFLVPLWATGELGVWSFEEPRSHLVWDEAGGAEPQPADEPGGRLGLMAQVLAGPLLLALAWSVRAARARGSREGRGGARRRLAP
jgi:hypothetical protein